MCQSLAIYLAIVCVVIVNTQPTIDPQYTEVCETDRQINRVRETLQRCQLIRQRLQTQLTELQNKYESVSQVLNAVLLQDKENTTCENSLNTSSFLDNPRLVGVIPAPVTLGVQQAIEGITVLGNQLFVIRVGSVNVEVYDTNNLRFSRNITITESSRLWAIVASPQCNCLFISDVILRVIYKYNLSDNIVSNWSVGGECYGLSLTNTHNVLVTQWNYTKLTEYLPDGTIIREIIMDSSINYSYHSIQLSSGQFVVSHGDGESLNRVCLLNTSGSIIQCYGGFSGSGVEQLQEPGDIAVDRYGNVLVTDAINYRIVLLSPSLTRLGYITIPGYTQIYSRALHLDISARRLYIGESTSNLGRIFLLSV